VGFHSKVAVFLLWMYSTFTYRRGARIVAGIDVRDRPARPAPSAIGRFASSIGRGVAQAGVLPPGVAWEHVAEFHAGAWLSHHGGDGVAPKLIVSGLLVCCGRLRRSVDFDEDKPRRIVDLLDDIEAGDAWFPDRLPGVLLARGLEGFDVLRLYVNSDMNDEHRAGGVGGE